MVCLSVDVCVCLSVSLSVWSECLCVCVSATHKRSAGAALAGTTWPSVPSPALVVNHSQSPCPRSYPWYVSGYPSHLGTATSTMQKVTSRIINTVSRCFSGTQAQHAKIRHKFHQQRGPDLMWPSSKKQATMRRSSQISSLRTVTAQTLLSCSTRTRLSLMLLSPLSTNPPPARTRGGWLHCLFVDCHAAHLSRALLRSHSALSTFTMSWPKSETPRPPFFKPCMRTCCSAMSTSSGVTST